MALYFITGNKSKFDDVKRLIPSLEQLDIDLPEIQEIDPHIVIKEKLLVACNHHDGAFIVEDTSVYLDCLGNLPGPLIKWFLNTLGPSGIHELCQKYDNYSAMVKVIFGYARGPDDITYFEQDMKGNIVAPKGNGGFGWDPIFSPEGETKSYGELKEDPETYVTCRKLACEKLELFLSEE